MSRYLISKSILDNVGNIIRDRLDTSNLYLPSEMGDAIRSFPDRNPIINIKTINTKHLSAGKYYCSISGWDGVSLSGPWPAAVNIDDRQIQGEEFDITIECPKIFSYLQIVFDSSIAFSLTSNITVSGDIIKVQPPINGAYPVQGSYFYKINGDGSFIFDGNDLDD